MPDMNAEIDVDVLPQDALIPDLNALAHLALMPDGRAIADRRIG